MIEKLTIEATIPTVQYGNIKPTIQLEGDNFEELRDLGLERIKKISDMTAGEGYTFEVRGLGTKRTVNVPLKALKTLTSPITGTSIAYDEDAHKYIGNDGQNYLSGSKFPEKFYAPFDKQMIIDAIIKKYPTASGPEIEAMWKLNNEASTGYGTAIHAALENYDKNRNLGEVIRGENPNKALSKNPFIKQLVEWFHEGRAKEEVLTEVFVSNDEFRVCGFVDRIKIVDREKKILRIQDYKTDGNIHQKEYQVKGSPFKGKIDNTLLGKHWLQLSFYAWICQKAGWTVEGLDIFWLNPEKLCKAENPWETFSHDVIDVTEGIIGTANV